jgi:hypothetical protein
VAPKPNTKPFVLKGCHATTLRLQNFGFDTAAGLLAGRPQYRAPVPRAIGVMGTEKHVMQSRSIRDQDNQLPSRSSQRYSEPH